MSTEQESRIWSCGEPVNTGTTTAIKLWIYDDGTDEVISTEDPPHVD